MDSFNIVQWNIRSLKTNKLFLLNILTSHKIHCAALSETWLSPTENIYINGYNIIRSDRADGYGGSGLLIKKGTNYTVINCNSFSSNKLQICGVKLNLNNKSTTILSVYASPKHKITSVEWYNILSNFCSPIIITGDFNAHHELWGCELADNEGKEIVEYLNDYNLIIMNDGTPTLFQCPGHRKSAIDLTICSPAIAPNITWQPLHSTYGSNHYPIKISVDAPTNYKFTIYPSSKWDIKKANWTEYHTISKTLTDNINQNNFLSSDLETKYELFTNIITQTAEKTIPKKTVKQVNSFRCSPWWDDECKNVIDSKRTAFNNFKVAPTLENFITCKRATAIAKRTLKQKKKQSWISFCLSINKNTNLTDVWQRVKLLNKNKTTQHKNQLSNELLYNFMATLTPPSCTEELTLHHLPNTTGVPDCTGPFTTEELYHSLKSTANSTPGLDNIHYSMLMNLASNTKLLLLNIYNHAWLQEETPAQWNIQAIVPIMKPNKDPNLYSSYRPISLFSCVLKTFERLIKTRLEWYLEHYSLLPSCQYGFRSGRNTMDSIAKLTTDIQINFSENKYLSALYLDLKGAFDHVSIKTLYDKMLLLGIPTKFSNTIVSIFKKRRVHLKYQDVKMEHRISNQGLPQGAVLSPLLFNIYTSDLNKIFHPNIKTLQFADDICIYVSKNSIRETECELSSAMKSFNKWALFTGFHIVPEKTIVSIYTRHRTPFPNNFILDNKSYKILPIVKFLGIYIDCKLTWRNHIRCTIQKTEPRLNVLRAVAHFNWGADPQTLIMLYKNLILTIIDYGSIIYGSATNTVLKPLDTLQNKALRIAIGALHSTPINNLLAETHVMPLNWRRRILSYKFTSNRLWLQTDISLAQLATDILTQPYWSRKTTPPLINSFTEVINNLTPDQSCSTLPCFKYNFLLSLPNNHFLDTTCLPTQQTKFNSEISKKWPNGWYLYTDASKTSDGVGCAFLDPSHNISQQFKLPKFISIYSAEMIAIHQCLAHIKNYSNYPNNIIIFSDSQTVIKKLKYPKFCNKNSEIIYSILKIISEIETGHIKLKVVWIRGHSGIVHNERVDVLAKQAIITGMDYFPPYLNQEITAQYKQRTWSDWNEEYKTSLQNKGQFYGRLHPQIPNKPWFTSKQPRKLITTIARLKFNHNFSKNHLHKINMSNTSTCDCDNVSTQDSNHLILACSKYQHNRPYFISELSKFNLNPPLNISTILNTKNQNIYELLYNFITQNDIKL